MPQISQILAQVFQSNVYKVWKEGCTVIPYTGVSTTFKSEGVRYQVPIVINGVLEYYEESFDATVLTRYPGSVATVRLKDEISGDVVTILGTETQWIDLSNGCCGETPQMDSVTLPVVPVEEEACCDTVITESDCIFVRTTAITTILAGQKVTVTGDNDGVAFTPAESAGFTSVAAAITWLNSNWNTYGTFTASGTNGIKLTSTTVKNGNFKLSFKALPFCLTAVAADVFDSVKSKGVIIPLGKQFTFSTAAQLIIDIAAYFPEATLTAFSATQVSYNGTGVPGGLYLGTTSVRNFVSGVCS